LFLKTGKAAPFGSADEVRHIPQAGNDQSVEKLVIRMSKGRVTKGVHIGYTMLDGRWARIKLASWEHNCLINQALDLHFKSPQTPAP
jgi:hypothetical protein